jgi:hypothetical protein
MNICRFFLLQLLDRLAQAQAGDEKAKIVLARYAQMIWSKREQEWWKSGILEGFVSLFLPHLSVSHLTLSRLGKRNCATGQS